MGEPLSIVIGGVQFGGELLETPAAALFRKNLPVYFKVRRHGKEYSGSLFPPLGHLDGEKTSSPEAGTIGWWEEGEALCFFAAKGDGNGPEVTPLCRVQGEMAKIVGLGAAFDVEIDLI